MNVLDLINKLNLLLVADITEKSSKKESEGYSRFILFPAARYMINQDMAVSGDEICITLNTLIMNCYLIQVTSWISLNETHQEISCRFTDLLRLSGLCCGLENLDYSVTERTFNTLSLLLSNCTEVNDRSGGGGGGKSTSYPQTDEDYDSVCLSVCLSVYPSHFYRSNVSSLRSVD